MFASLSAKGQLWRVPAIRWHLTCWKGAIITAALAGKKMTTREQEFVKALFIELEGSPLETFPALRGELKAPCVQGVYVIYGPLGRVAHVGRTLRAKGGIAQRLRSHMSGTSSFAKISLKGKGSKLRCKYKFRSIKVVNPRRRALLEAFATGRLCPTHIGLGKRVFGKKR